MALFRAEICEAGDAVLFSSLQQRLMRRLKDEIRTGNFTERGLARRAGLSQPHVHNLLKGIRSATVESADAMLRAISADVIDLLHAPEAERVSRLTQGPTAAVARLRGAAGPGGRWDERSDSSQCTAVPCKLLAGVRQPAMLTVLPDPEMDGISGIALVDLRVSTDSTFPQSDLYITVRNDEPRLRYIRSGRDLLYFASCANLNRPREWDSVPRDADLAGIVRARAVCPITAARPPYRCSEPGWRCGPN